MGCNYLATLLLKLCLTIYTVADFNFKRTLHVNTRTWLNFRYGNQKMSPQRTNLSIRLHFHHSMLLFYWSILRWHPINSSYVFSFQLNRFLFSIKFNNWDRVVKIYAISTVYQIYISFHLYSCYCWNKIWYIYISYMPFITISFMAKIRWLIWSI